jgi:hypothetical protein
MAIAQPLPQKGRLRAAWDALLGHTADAAAAAAPAASFAEVVWAHHQRQQKEVYKDEVGGRWHDEFQQRLDRFRAEHGDIIDVYWCRHEASGVALTERRLPRRARRFLRGDSLLRIHTATDWRTANAPTIASSLHRWETAAIKSSEVLRDSSERIALHRIFSASTRLLAAVDRKRALPAEETNLDAVVEDQGRELAEVETFYQHAGENAARLVYFEGMVWGTALFALLLGGGFLGAWALGWLNPHHEPTYTLFVTAAMGAAGAIFSVMTRMAKPEGFSLEFEVGRKSMRFLGAIRPWIGALSAFVIYLALKSNLVELIQGTEKGIYFYATIAFASGFSERRAKVLLTGIDGGGSTGGGKGDDDSRAHPGPANRSGSSTVIELVPESEGERPGP